MLAEEAGDEAVVGAAGVEAIGEDGVFPQAEGPDGVGMWRRGPRSSMGAGVGRGACEEAIERR
jgi:hypothetical protein